MATVGFEPTPTKRLVPKTSALDHSATLPCIPSFASKNKFIFPFWHKDAWPNNKNLIITGYRIQSLVQADIVSRQLQREQNILRSMEKRSCMALVTTRFLTIGLPFLVSAAFPVRFCFFIVTMSPQSCIVKEKSFYQLFIAVYQKREALCVAQEVNDYLLIINPGV